MTAKRPHNATQANTARDVDAAVLALARLLGRQLARQSANAVQENKDDQNQVDRT
jgi:hypothetical protein